MVAMNSARLRLARELSGLSQTDAASIVAITAAALSQLESGSSRPTRATLGRLASAYGVPTAFFELVMEPVHEGFFRSLRRTSAIDRRRAQAVAYIARDIATLSSHPTSHSSVPVLTRLARRPTPNEIEDAAGRVRSEWRIPAGPIPNVVDLLEKHGVIVIRLALESSDVDAFSVAFVDRPVVVLASNKSDRARSRFDAAHELGHLVLHGSEIWGVPDVEQEAHLFASAFLLPRDQIYAELPDRVDWPALFDLKRRWQVSLAALLMRARALGRLSEFAYLAAIKTASARGWRRVEPIAIGPAEQPKLLSALLDSPARLALQRVLPGSVLDALTLMTPLPVPQRASRRFEQGAFDFDTPSGQD
jgi:Zn-dependent peptidase ImmA (M78 family)/transcriptional regulator with XRE-family HTH domain